MDAEIIPRASCPIRADVSQCISSGDFFRSFYLTNGLLYLRRHEKSSKHVRPNRNELLKTPVGHSALVCPRACSLNFMKIFQAFSGLLLHFESK